MKLRLLLVIVLVVVLNGCAGGFTRPFGPSQEDVRREPPPGYSVSDLPSR
ncbi:MAG: hypothetical protein ACOC7T_02645 [Planctomycetota bacterium]